MYGFPDMIEMGLKDDDKWASDIHKIVAISCCICNPSVFTRETLQKNVDIINNIPDDKIKLVTLQDLEDMGCEIPS